MTSILTFLMILTLHIIPLEEEHKIWLHVLLWAALVIMGDQVSKIPPLHNLTAAAKNINCVFNPQIQA